MIRARAFVYRMCFLLLPCVFDVRLVVSLDTFQVLVGVFMSIVKHLVVYFFLIEGGLQTTKKHCKTLVSNKEAS